jgi:hypothetical protein
MQDVNYARAAKENVDDAMHRELPRPSTQTSQERYI